MKQGKNKKIIIIAMIAIVVLCIAIGIVIAVMGSNSNKDLFFKYIGKAFSTSEGFSDAKLEQYNEKKNNTVYENYGEFSATVDSENIDQDTLDIVNNMNISFIGNVDKTNDAMEELIKLNYTDDVNFSINFKKVEDSYGIRLNDVAKQFLVVETDELGDLLENLGITDTTISSIDFSAINTDNIKFSESDKSTLKDVYLKQIQDSLSDDNFSKVSSTEMEGYELKISNQKLKEILISLLETLKTDDQMLTKLSSIIGQEVDESTIDTLIENLNSQETEDGEITITIYQNDGVVKKMSLQIDDQVKIEISKNSTDDTAEYNVDITASNMLINLVASYNGLQLMTDVNENYSLNMSVGDTASTGYTYNIENEIKFIDSVEITDFSDSDSLILNDLSDEKLSKVFEQISNKIDEVNTEQMQEIGIEGDNPLLYIIPGFSQITSLVDSSNQVETTAKDSLDNSIGTISETAILTFNSNFTSYESDQLKGSNVKMLIQTVIASNMANEDHQIDVTGDIEVINEQVPDNIETSKTYSVQCNYDDDGYINNIEIKEN